MTKLFHSHRNIVLAYSRQLQGEAEVIPISDVIKSISKVADAPDVTEALKIISQRSPIREIQESAKNKLAEFENASSDLDDVAKRILAKLMPLIEGPIPGSSSSIFDISGFPSGLGFSEPSERLSKVIEEIDATDPTDKRKIKFILESIIFNVTDDLHPSLIAAADAKMRDVPKSILGPLVKDNLADLFYILKKSVEDTSCSDEIRNAPRVIKRFSALIRYSHDSSEIVASLVDFIAKNHPNQEVKDALNSALLVSPSDDLN